MQELVVQTPQAVATMFVAQCISAAVTDGDKQPVLLRRGYLQVQNNRPQAFKAD